jgi:hypothetical protein
MAIPPKDSALSGGPSRTRDGAASVRLREVENANLVSRRGVLWRAAGLAAGAAGAVGLSALDAGRVDATTSNFVLGTGNTTDATTTLTPTTTLNPMMHINGSAMGITDTTLIVDGPNGGTALKVNTGAGPSGTVGLALGVSAAGGSTAVAASSGSGVGGQFSSSTGNALAVAGKARFSRSGRATVLAGRSYVDITVAGGLTSHSMVHATLQTYRGGVAVAAVRINYPSPGKARIYLTKVASSTASTYVGWFVAEF